MDFLKEIVKEIGDEYTQIASDIDETERFIDTGSYIFNGLISGSILGGVSSNRITAIAGESSTGKTYFSLAIVKNFLDTNPDGYCLYFDTEAAVSVKIETIPIRVSVQKVLDDSLSLIHISEPTRP